MNNDPFADIRGKRMSELTEEQRDRAFELWLREQMQSFPRHYWEREDSLFPSVLRVIDRLRAPAAPVAVPAGWRLVPAEATPEMVTAYLAWNTAYWRRADELPTSAHPGTWRSGTPAEATTEGYRAMIAAAPEPAQPQGAAVDMTALVDARWYTKPGALEALRDKPAAEPQAGRWYAASEIDGFVRDLDIAMNGDGAAPQAMLCDLMPQLTARLKVTAP